MTTFTLIGDITALTGFPSRVTVAVIRAMPGPISDPVNNITFVQNTQVPIVDGQLEVELPAEAVPVFYWFRLELPQLGMWWQFPSAPAGTVLYLSDFPGRTNYDPFDFLLGPLTEVISIDTDGAPYIDAVSGTHSVFLDTDGVPYFADAPAGETVYLDSDGMPVIPSLALEP